MSVSVREQYDQTGARVLLTYDAMTAFNRKAQHGPRAEESRVVLLVESTVFVSISDVKYFTLSCHVAGKSGFVIDKPEGRTRPIGNWWP